MGDRQAHPEPATQLRKLAINDRWRDDFDCQILQHLTRAKVDLYLVADIMNAGKHRKVAAESMMERDRQKALSALRAGLKAAIKWYENYTPAQWRQDTYRQMVEIYERHSPGAQFPVETLNRPTSFVPPTPRRGPKDRWWSVTEAHLKSAGVSRRLRANLRDFAGL